MNTEVSNQIAKSLENERKINASEMTNKLKTIEDKIAKNRETFENLMKGKCEDLSCRIEHALGATCFVQTNTLIEAKNYYGAFISAIDAINSFVDADEHVNLRRIMNVLITECLPSLNKDKLRMTENTEQSFEDTMEKIKKWDEKKDFFDLISEARKTFKSASERAPQTAITPA